MLPENVTPNVGIMFRLLRHAEEKVFQAPAAPEIRIDGTLTGSWCIYYRQFQIVLSPVEHFPDVLIHVYVKRDVLQGRPGRIVWSPSASNRDASSTNRTTKEAVLLLDINAAFTFCSTKAC